MMMPEREEVTELLDVALTLLRLFRAGKLTGPGLRSGIVDRLSDAVVAMSVAPEGGALRNMPDVVGEALPLLPAAYEAACYARALREHGDSGVKAAEALGMSRSTFYRRIRRAQRWLDEYMAAEEKE